MAAGSGRSAGGPTSGAKRVLRTGLALVHENEIVYPAAGSEAIARRVVDDTHADIEMHFPVTIEIIDGSAHAEVIAEASAERGLRGVGHNLRPR